MSKHVLIVGSGSVGKRHARNLHALGCRVSAMDPRADRLTELAAETPCETGYDTLEAALADARFDGVVIGSPPHVHVEQCLASIAAGLPILLEKPVCPDLAGATRLQRCAGAVPVLLGYTWRWWPPLERVRQLLTEDVIGPVRHVRFVMSAHLADWHPWERYQDFFMARRGMGGGALLDESHWVDLALWLFGMPDAVSARIDRISDLEIDSDDNVDMLLSFGGGPRVSLHLDLFGRPHEKSITFVGERGTLAWSAEPNRIALGRSPAGWDQVEEFSCERNDMFVAVARDFLALMHGHGAVRCSLRDGVDVLRVLEAARLSSAAGRQVALKDVP